MTSSWDKSSEQAIVLGLLDAVERGHVTQRRLSTELGIALGLVNTYVRRCINKGFIKVRQVPKKRYSYYLTPKGFLEKSQLVGSYFYHSFDFFRRARTSCETTLGALAELGHARVGLVGASELAEIAAIVAADMNIRITAVVDPDLQRPQFVGIPVVASAEAASDIVDVVMITSLLRPRESYEAAAEALGMARVFMPALLADLAVRRPSEQQQHEREAKRRNSA